MSKNKMSEQEWRQSRDGLGMWLSLPDGFLSARRMRLFAVACCRRIWPLLMDGASRAAVELAEQSADEPIELFASRLASGEAERAYEDAMTDANGDFLPDDDPILSAAHAASYASNAELRPGEVAEVLMAAVEASSLGAEEEFAAQARLLRDIAGDASRQLSLDPAWLTWQAGLVERLAEGIYDDRAFDRMPILGDALEDAGCTDEAILAHCREPGAHVRGCWVVDLVLGKR